MGKHIVRADRSFDRVLERGDDYRIRHVSEYAGEDAVTGRPVFQEFVQADAHCPVDDLRWHWHYRVELDDYPAGLAAAVPDCLALLREFMKKELGDGVGERHSGDAASSGRHVF